MSFRSFYFFLFFPTVLFSYSIETHGINSVETHGIDSVETHGINSIETHGINICPRIQLSCAFCGSISNEKTCVIIPYRWDPLEKKHICGRVECNNVKESEKRMVEQDDGKRMVEEFSLNNNPNLDPNIDDTNSTQVF